MNDFKRTMSLKFENDKKIKCKGKCKEIERKEGNFKEFILEKILD